MKRPRRFADGADSPNGTCYRTLNKGWDLAAVCGILKWPTKPAG
jgi:hypothetical protein